MPAFSRAVDRPAFPTMFSAHFEDSMPAKARAAAKSARKPARKSAKSKAAPARKLGALPERNLTDLYPAMDAPELKRDLAKADADSIAFEQDFKGKLADLAKEGKLIEAVKRYEALDDLL